MVVEAEFTVLGSFQVIVKRLVPFASGNNLPIHFFISLYKGYIDYAKGLRKCRNIYS